MCLCKRGVSLMTTVTCGVNEAGCPIVASSLWHMVLRNHASDKVTTRVLQKSVKEKSHASRVSLNRAR